MLFNSVVSPKKIDHGNLLYTVAATTLRAIVFSEFFFWEILTEPNSYFAYGETEAYLGLALVLWNKRLRGKLGLESRTFALCLLYK
jgi:hypothetical protein